MTSQLIEGFCYVQFLFADGTRQTIRTTLSRELLKNIGAELKEDYLFDIRHGEYVKMRQDAVDVIVSKDKPEAKGVLDKFADRFI